MILQLAIKYPVSNVPVSISKKSLSISLSQFYVSRSGVQQMGGRFHAVPESVVHLHTFKFNIGTKNATYTSVSTMQHRYRNFPKIILLLLTTS